jgi:hypothetical protein
MSVPIRLVLSAALLTLLALPAVSTATIADDHDHYRVDRDGDRGDHDRYRAARDEDRGYRDDHERGDKSHFSGLLKHFLAEGDHDRGSTGRVSGASGGHYSGVPGPIAGAGLPILALGYGVYWLIRRSRRKPN